MLKVLSKIPNGEICTGQIWPAYNGLPMTEITLNKYIRLR